MIEVKNLTKIFGKKQSAFTALNDVSFSVKNGTAVAIVGKSGSGKSTLMHVMSGLDRPTEGSIMIGGQNLHKMKTKAMDTFRSRSMSFIFQAFFVEANQKCVDNVSLPLEIAKMPSNKRHRLSMDALEAVELTDKAKVKARNLSGGQKQRLAIARAIVNKPKLIFADEPTGNLDSVTGEKVIQLLFDQNKKLGSTLFIVTHDHDLARRCDTRIYMKDGKVEKIESGRPVIKKGSKK